MNRMFVRLSAGGAAALLVSLLLVFLSGGDAVHEVDQPAEHFVITPAPSAQAQLAADVQVPDEWVVASATAQAPPPENVPEVDESDTLVRRLVAELSTRSEMASWMVTDGLIRRFVAATHAIAGGYSPREELAFLRPSGTFVVQRRQQTMVIAPSSFKRYDTLVDVFASLDSSGLLRLYDRLEPLIEEAYREQPWTRGEFSDVMIEAMDHLLATPTVSGLPAVERGTVHWVFADDFIEGLSDAQRHLLRMGPRNVSIIQAKIRELHRAFAPGEPIPQPAVLDNLREGSPRAAVDSASRPSPVEDQLRTRLVDDSRSARPF